MKILTALVLAASLITSAFAADVEKRSVKNESLRLEKLPNGYLVALRSLPAAGTQFLDIRIKLKKFDTVNGSFVAVGMGDLYKYYDKGEMPLGEGYLIGANVQCPKQNIAIELYSYTAPNLPINCKNTLADLQNDTVYQIRVTVNAKGDLSLMVEDENDVLLARLSKPAVSVAQYSKGLFIVPIGKSSYELIGLSAGSE